MSSLIDFIELRLYTSYSATDYVLLPNYSALSFDVKYNDVSAIEFEYPLDDAKNVAGLKDQSLIGAVLGFSNGTSREVERFIIEGTDDTKVSDDTRMMQVNGRSTLGTYMEDATVYPSNWPVTSPTGHEFVNNTVGTIMRTLMQRAKERGCFPFVSEMTFSGTSDSAGAAWAAQHSQNYATGTTYLQLLKDFMDLGYADAWMDGNNFRIQNGGARGQHIGIGTVELRPAQNVSEMVTTTKSSESITTVLIEGEAGTSIERHRQTFQDSLGRRRERYVQQGGIADAGVLTLLADADLELNARIPTEETLGVANTGLTPFEDFDIADWVWVRYDTEQAPVERRVRQIAVSVDAAGTITLGLTLNSILYEGDVALQRRMDQYTGKGGSYGSVPNSGVDITVPNAPVGLAITAGNYWDSISRTYVGAFVANWLTPTLNEDGTAFDDLDHYELRWHYTDSTDWSAVLSTSGSETTLGYSPVTPGRSVNAQVRAVDKSGNPSQWSVTATGAVPADLVPPPKTSTPTALSRLGTIRAYWDGKDSTGAAMPEDFWYVSVHLGPNSAYAPTDANRVATLDGAGQVIAGTDLAYNSTHWVKIVPYDLSGNKGPASDGFSVTVKALVDTDLIGEILSGAHLVPGTVTYKHLAIGDFTNYAIDFNDEALREETPAGALNSGNWHWNELPSDLLDPWRLRLTPNDLATTANRHQSLSSNFSVRPGEQFSISYQVFTESGVDYPINVGLQGYNEAGTVVNFATSVNAVTHPASGTDGQWVTVSGSVTVAAGVSNARIDLNALMAGTNVSGANRNAYVRRVLVRRKGTGGSLIVDGTIHGGLIESLAINTGHLQANVVTTPKLDVGSVTADKISVGARGISTIKNSYMEDPRRNPDGSEKDNGHPVNWQTIYANGGTPAVSGETSTPIAGSRSMKVVLGTDMNPVIGGQDNFPVTEKQKWYVRATVRAVTAFTGPREVLLRLHTAKPPSTPFGIFDPNVVWHTFVKTGPFTAGQTFDIEGTLTVPDGHTLGNASIAFGGAAPTQAGTFLVDSVEAWPATTDAQITEIGPGKIQTGTLHALTRIIAGTDGAARTEMTGTGFRAYNGLNQQMFEVQGSTGDTYVGNPGGIHVKMGAYSNPWGQSYSQGMLEFRYAGSGWGPGQIIGHYWTDGGLNWSAVRISSPYNSGLGAGQANAAYLDLRNEAGGASQFFLHAKEANFDADTYIMGSGGSSTTVDFRLAAGAPGFTFTDYSALSRLNLYPDVGKFTLRAGDSAGAARNLVLNGAEVQFLSGSHTVYFHLSNSDPGFHHFGRNVGLAYGFDRMRVTTYNNDVWMPIAASAFVVGSDPRLKENSAPVSGALKALSEMNVYDYDMEGLLPRTSKRVMGKGQSLVKARRGRGLMADELQKILPDAVNEDDNGFLSISLYDLSATTVAAVKELHAEVQELRDIIKKLTKGSA